MMRISSIIDFARGSYSERNLEIPRISIPRKFRNRFSFMKVSESDGISEYSEDFKDLISDEILKIFVFFHILIDRKFLRFLNFI